MAASLGHMTSFVMQAPGTVMVLVRQPHLPCLLWVLFCCVCSRIVATTRHTWQDSSDGLQLRTQQWLGLMAPQSSTTFDSSFLAPVVNLVIKDK